MGRYRGKCQAGMRIMVELKGRERRSEGVAVDDQARIEPSQAVSNRLQPLCGVVGRDGQKFLPLFSGTVIARNARPSDVRV